MSQRGLKPVSFRQLTFKMRRGAQNQWELDEVNRRVNEFIKERRSLHPITGRPRKEEESDAVAVISLVAKPAIAAKSFESELIVLDQATMDRTGYSRHRVKLNDRYKSAGKRGDTEGQREVTLRKAALKEARKVCG